MFVDAVSYTHLEEIVTKGVQNAKKAVEETGKDGYVALDVGPTGKLLKPLGTLDFEDAVSIFARTIKAGAAAGADLILIETMSDTYELKACLLYTSSCRLESLTLNDSNSYQL